jgi:hypothetical protein
MPTTKHQYSFNLFNETMSVWGETLPTGDREFYPNLTVEDAKQIFPEDSEYIDWFYERYK